MAIGSRRTTPTWPVAAAVVSEPMVAPDEDAVLPVAALEDERGEPGAAAAEDDGGEGHALRVLPARGHRSGTGARRR